MPRNSECDHSKSTIFTMNKEILPRGHGLDAWSHYKVADSNGHLDLFRDEHATGNIMKYFL